MFLRKLGSALAGLIALAHRPGAYPTLTPSGRPTSGRALIVLDERVKVMRPRRWSRDGKRQLPAETARHLICTHRPHGKTWPRKPTPITEAWGIAR